MVDDFTFQGWLDLFEIDVDSPSLNIRYCRKGVELANLEILSSHDRTVPFNYDKNNMDYVIKEHILHAKN